MRIKLGDTQQSISREEPKGGTPGEAVIWLYLRCAAFGTPSTLALKPEMARELYAALRRFDCEGLLEDEL